MKNAREEALKILYRVEYEGAYPNIAIKDALKDGFSVQDKAFVTNMVYGVINRKLTLDYIIAQKSKIKLKKLSKYILLILRMGIYQLEYMDKIPESAAVNESVKLAKRYGHSASSGYVNGILRNVAKNGFEYPKDKIERLSVEFSFPMWICQKWVKEFGYEFCSELMHSFGEEPDLILRPNLLKINAQELAERLTQKGINAKAGENCVECSGFDIANDSLYLEGYYTVQDKAAMAAAIVLAPQSGETVIDMCAAPGGKTTHIAELMQNQGKVLAFDIYEHKVELIYKNAQRLGLDIISSQLKDASVLDEALIESADRVLCDVPCSGMGILRRKPDIKWNRKEDDSFYQIQKKILENASKYLKKGGEIVYSTCSIEKEENEEVTNKFLAENKNFQRLYEKTYYPNIDGTDGFYICKMKKN